MNVSPDGLDTDLRIPMEYLYRIPVLRTIALSMFHFSSSPDPTSPESAEGRLAMAAEDIRAARSNVSGCGAMCEQRDCTEKESRFFALKRCSKVSIVSS